MATRRTTGGEGLILGTGIAAAVVAAALLAGSASASSPMVVATASPTRRIRLLPGDSAYFRLVDTPEDVARAWADSKGFTVTGDVHQQLDGSLVLRVETTSEQIVNLVSETGKGELLVARTVDGRTVYDRATRTLDPARAA